MKRFLWSLCAALLSIPAHATGLSPEPGVGQPVDKGLGFQPAASELKEQMAWFHDDLLLPIITVITVFVLALLIWVVIRYNRRANPNPSKTAHNTFIEVVWTVVPIIILIVIAIPSLKLLYYTERNPEQTEMTLKVIGHQWYWEYVYPDHNGVTFSAYMKKKEELLPGEPRLLETDRRVVLPVDTNIKFQITAADVLHAFTVPAFGIKRDAVPGRLNETWVKVNKTGVFYGQCSELCGTDHAYMPIAVEVVSKEAFAAWVAKQQAEQGLVPAAASPPEAAPAPAPTDTKAQ
jgi:cytochrome c oxidase subunit II